MIKVSLPDGSIKEFEKGTTPLDVANSISAGLARNVISAKFNKETVEVSTPLTTDGSLALFTWKDDEGKKAFWHSSAHVMAQTIEEMYPGSKLTIGPAIKNGFYYDVDFGEHKISENDFKKIEDRMLQIAREKHEFKLREVSKADAISYYKERDNQFKVELIENLQDGDITFCDHDSFTDLCRGGHIPNTGFIKAVKLMSAAGAYWRGDENNQQLTRIYGISFPKQKELKEYLALLEEAKKRDHRKLGKELQLFTFSQKVGQGLPLWLPKGAALRERLETAFHLFTKSWPGTAIMASKRSSLKRTSGKFLKKSPEKSRLRNGSYSTYWPERTLCNFRALCEIWRRQLSTHSYPQ